MKNHNQNCHRLQRSFNLMNSEVNIKKGNKLDTLETPPILYSRNQIISHFKIKKISLLDDIQAVAYEMYHESSGAKLIYLHTDDKENLFSVAFKTPPPNDAGLPHILEHTVLCGSKQFPVKDPFVELLKTSLATFLNAMTYPDKTVYPCASMNEKDFHNLINVYCDAVFFPLLTEKHFKQEGHHYNFLKNNDTTSPLSIKGIVYNEMKGVYSDLNGIISREEAKSIFPDTAYGKDSGGDPRAIASLTYAEFVDYHHTYYHPSNAYLFIYGNFDITKTLSIIHLNYLSKFKRINLNTKIKIQKKWTKHIRKTIEYPISNSDTLNNKTAITVNFLTNNLTDSMDSLALSILEIYLLDNSSSPLRKALIDSKLGESLTSSGYADYQRDTYFTIGLKGTEPEHADSVLKIITNTFKSIIKDGLDKKKLDSVFHKLELHSKEIQSSYPLTLMDRIYNYWLYDANPLSLLQINSLLKKLRENYNNNPKFFEKIIEKYFINNEHYSVLTFIPDKKYLNKQNKLFKDNMAQMKNKMSDNELKIIAEEAKELNHMQHEANSKEALATLPRLSISDVSKTPMKLDSHITQIQTRPFIISNIFSNDINYLNLAFDLRNIDSALIDYLPIFKTALLKMGAAGLNYAEMAEREAAVTGGIGAGLMADGKFDNNADCFPYLSLSTKAISSKHKEMLKVFYDRIVHCEFDDVNRLKDILLQKKNQLKGSIINSGSSYAVLFASKNINANHNLSERFTGISYIRLVQSLSDNFESIKDELIQKLKDIKKFILNKNRVYASFVGTNNDEIITKQWFDHLLKSLSCIDIKLTESSFYPFPKLISSSGIIIPSEVSFNAAVFPTIGPNNQNAPVLLFLTQYLSFGYLWDEIRAKRGAYGAKASYSILNGNFMFSTYRDPNIKKSYETFNRVFDFILNKMDLSSNAIEQIMIGSIKKLDRPQRPGEAAGLSLLKYLRNISNEHLQEFRTNLLKLDRNIIVKTVKEILIPAYKSASICSIGNKNNLTHANKYNELNNMQLEEL